MIASARRVCASATAPTSLSLRKSAGNPASFAHTGYSEVTPLSAECDALFFGPHATPARRLHAEVAWHAWRRADPI